MLKKKTMRVDEPGIKDSDIKRDNDDEVVLVTENDFNDDRFVNVSFKISYNLLMKLDAFASRNRLSRSDVIRYAIEELLKNEGEI
jgi:hypothetical protein